MFNLIGGYGVSGLNLWSLVVAVVGAVIFIGILRALRGSPHKVA